MLQILRPQMVSIVELRDDCTFNTSAIGNAHGDIYEALFDYAKDSELNNGNLPPYYEKYMKPLILGSDEGKFKL